MSALNWCFYAVLAVALVAPIGASAQVGAAGNEQTVNRVKESAMESTAVTVTGRVEDVDQENNTFTLSDDTGQIDISTVTPPAELQEGQQVRVSGTVSEPTSGEKNIVAATIDVLAHGEETSEGKKGSLQARQPR